MTKSKEKGTAAESLVVKYLQSTYWPHAERRALSGGLDKGDITGTPGLAWEVKAAKTLCVPAWLRETETERINAKADYATLVIKPQGVGGKNVGEFYALMDNDNLERLLANFSIDWPLNAYTFQTTIRRMKFDVAAQVLSVRSEVFAWVIYPGFVFMRLDQMCRLLFLAGYGSNDKREKDQA